MSKNVTNKEKKLWDKFWFWKIVKNLKIKYTIFIILCLKFFLIFVNLKHTTVISDWLNKFKKNSYK